MPRISVILLLSTLLLTGCKSEPRPATQEAAKPAAPEQKKSAILASYPGKDTPFQMSLELEPARPLFADKTKTRIRLTDLAGKPVEGAKLHASLVMPLMDMGKNEYDLQPAGGGVYEGTANFTMAGEWEIILTATAGNKTGTHTFNVMVEE